MTPSTRRRLRTPILATVLMVGGCAGPESAAVEEPTWTGTMGARLKAGIRAIQDATPELPRMSRIVQGSDRCTISASGDADCGEAAIRICKARGYDAGQAIDTASVNSCRPRSVDQLQSGDGLSCKTKYQVTAALCW
ncbi:hypothetical protein [Microvirga puerhi]|uniref:Lipoprotein n=1 Tax=Microvirga puerhi TaxID=2876078 RepID=A0ABS7VGS4_9HYPH|nr:hypothetical protein [Microvirga puerhi]MBZ6074703.1 hypothetical protein [Microvirga puerhi]